MKIKDYKTLKDNNDLNLFIVKSRKQAKQKYFRNHNCFDIEVTNYIEGDRRAGIPYLWMYSMSANVVYYGRTLEEFKEFIDEYYKLIESKEAMQVIYVHNLAYEFQFIRKMFEWDEVFLIDARKPLYVRYKCFEFRCSYLLSNMSLDNFLRNYDCELLKLDYDYTKRRFPWQNLSEEELQYCAVDTAGLYECISKVLDKDKKDVTNIPLTSTGYVRQDIKRSQTPAVKQIIKRLSNISPEVYLALKASFVGGNTHANRMYANSIIEDINCYDISSSYPYCQMCSLYPMEPFREKKSGFENFEMDSKFAYLLFCEFTDIELIDYFDGMPNISVSKCVEKDEFEQDNGRILSADRILIWQTDIEYHITEHHYKFNVRFLKVYYSRYGELPECIKGTIYTYFYNKCTLKQTDPYLYMKSKNKLNSIYGMSAFDIGKRRFTYEDGEYIQDKRDVMAILSNILETTTQAEPYMWGVWTTARARENLDKVIRLAGDRFVYCDTDSIYVYGELDLTEINEEIARQAEPYVVEYKGRKYYFGIWEHDKHCNKFVTLGAKKYCYEDEDGVHTVTAGVSKKAGVDKIEDYEIGHIFKDATNNAWYIDEDETFYIDEHCITIPSSIYIESADYTLGVTENYRALLLYCNLAGIGYYSE